MRSGAPRIDRKGRRVGTEHHVELFPANETVDRAPVEGNAALERVVELLDRDRNVLANAKNVGEDETDEAHVLFAREFDDFAFVGRAAPL